MSNQIGNTLKLQIFGESHGPYIGAVLTGLAPGFLIDETYIDKQPKARQSHYDFNTDRHENDEWQIISGVYQGRTTGAPLTVLIPNNDQDPSTYDKPNIPRPSHADYAANIKYNDFNDPRGGGVFSGRTTVALVALGAVCRDILGKKGIVLGSHIQQLAELSDNYKSENLEKLIVANLSEPFVVYDEEIKAQMIKLLNKTKDQKDSLGAVLESHILNLPVGIGEPYFAGLESALAVAVFSIPGIKGLQFGSGFSLVNLPGSAANDEFFFDGDRVKTTTNHSGGINGGLSNGMPLSFRTVVKAPASIAKAQRTVDLESRQETRLTISGRHDSFIANRVLVVLDNLCAFVILDLCLSQYGREWML